MAVTEMPPMSEPRAVESGTVEPRAMEPRSVAKVASTVANMSGKVLKGQNMLPSEFMPKYEKPEEPDPMAFFGAM